MAAALLAAAGTARAAPVGVVPVGVVIVDAPGAPVTADELARAVAAAGRAAGAAVDPEPFARARAQLERGAVPAGRLVAFERARELARQGWNAYLAVDPERARAHLDEARRAAEDVLDLDGGLALHANLSLRLGAVLLQLGDSAGAARALALARALDPGRPVTIAEFAPQVVEAYQAAAPPGLPTAPRIAVELSVAPASARLELDGRDLGAGPRTVDLAAGSHVLVARAPGHASRGRAFTVTAARRVDMVLTPDPEAAAVLAGRAALAPGQARAPAEAALRGLWRYAELDSVVLVASVWRRGQPALLGQRCAGQAAGERVRCTAVVEIGYARARDTAAAAAELWTELGRASRRRAPALVMDSRLVAPDHGPGQRQSRDGPRCRWCRSRWLWVGVGVAALAAGSVWLIVRDHDREPVITVDPCQFGGCAP